LQDTQTLSALSKFVSGDCCRRWSCSCGYALKWTLGPPFDGLDIAHACTDASCPWCYSDAKLADLKVSACHLPWLHSVHNLLTCPDSAEGLLHVFRFCSNMLRFILEFIGPFIAIAFTSGLLISKLKEPGVQPPPISALSCLGCLPFPLILRPSLQKFQQMCGRQARWDLVVATA
jgi:hypothetical protein